MERQLHSRRYTAWQLIKAYWQSDHRASAYLFLLSVLFMTILIVGMEVVFNTWYNHFYNALQDYKKTDAIDLLVIFAFLASIYIVLQVYRYYINQTLGMRWRRWLTDQLLNRWLQRKSYYYLENFEEHTDNPDQRIQEDAGLLVTYSLDLTVGLIGAVTTVLAFVYILWTLSGVITLPLGAWGVLHIPGYLVWVAVIYALVGTFFTYKIGRPLVPLNFEQQRREADFRFAAVDLRTHAENVALYHGEHQQQNLLKRLVNRFIDNWYNIILRQKKLLWFTAGYNQVSVLIPLLVVLPNYFNKVFKLGGLMQSLSAFRQIQESLSFIVNSYTTIAQWQAVIRRLLTFLNHIYDVEHYADKKNHFSYQHSPEDNITAKNITIFTPHGEKLLENINKEFVHGHHYLISGVSGIGKSTFVRVIAGIWPYGSGVITLPEHKKIMYIPQKIYMPIGTLREALLFPSTPQGILDITLVKLLQDCDLPDLANQLDHFSMWSEQLSPGEQQRIAFVRILLFKPDWVFLDEATSALDLDHEKKLYQLLRAELPHCSIITIGHQPSLEQFHDQFVDMAAFKGEKLLSVP